MASVFGWGQYSGIGIFTKINNTSELTDGYYVIAGNGSSNKGLMLNTSTGSTGYINRTSVTTLGTTLTNPSVNNVFYISISNGSYIIHNEELSNYASLTNGTSNSATFVTSAPTNKERWTITASSGLFEFINVEYSTRKLNWNNSSPRFACYTTTQVPLTIYKMEQTDPTLTVSPTSLTVDSYIEGNGPVATATTLVNVTGENLEGDVTVTAPANFEISTSATTGFGSTITLTESGGEVDDDVYIRLIGGLQGSETAYTGNLTVTSPNADDETVSISGIVQDALDVSKLDWPLNGTITEGNTFNVYIKAYEPGLTDVAGNESQITAWVGYSDKRHKRIIQLAQTL